MNGTLLLCVCALVCVHVCVCARLCVCVCVMQGRRYGLIEWDYHMMARDKRITGSEDIQKVSVQLALALGLPSLIH